MKKVAVLGSTGSIGTQTLDVISHLPNDYQVIALAAGRNINLLQRQIEQFHPLFVSVTDKEGADRLRPFVSDHLGIFYGSEGPAQLIRECEPDYVVCAFVGSVGISSTLAAIELGADIGLANKETLVMAGHLVMKQAAEKKVRILPIDSEHSALFQCLNGEHKPEVQRLILTASGGSFRHLKRDQLKEVTVKDALKHPNWSMGAKITVDSATMANKGLEMIEAHWLFNIPYKQIEVILHPESIVHSLVEFTDSSVIAQMGNPDMHLPIQYALTYPKRMPGLVKSLDLRKVGSLHFEDLHLTRYPLLKLASDVGKLGGSTPAVFNAANECAVAFFLQQKIPFLAIEEVVESVLNQHKNIAEPSLEQILEEDRWARRVANQIAPIFS